VLQRQGVREKVVGVFGPVILNPAGKIDRRKLAEIAFGDADRLSSLNRIIHPLVLERAGQLIRQYGLQRQIKAIVLDMPLLAEVNWAERCDRLIFVDCQWKLRLDRAKKLGLDENQMRIRENSQISLDKKVNMADNVINNNSDFSALSRQVTEIFSHIVNSG
jgi:dephospho-CoA kinase